jgi:hypothetical protein
MPRALTSTADFVAWMRDEYLSELVLLAAKPKPPLGATKRAPREVVLEFGQRDPTASGAKERFTRWVLTCSQVALWQADGALSGDAELTVEVVEGAAAAVALRLRAGGTATIGCASVKVEPSTPVVRKARPRPWQHDFAMFADDVERTVGELLDHASADRLASLDREPVVADSAWKLAEVRAKSARAWMLSRGGVDVACIATVHRASPGWTMSVQRVASAGDAEWERVWRLPVRLGAREVRSRTLVTDATGWATWDFRRGALP